MHRIPTIEAMPFVMTCPGIAAHDFLLDNETPSHNMARMPRPTARRSPYRVQVLDRALAALEILANRDGECSLVDLCTEMKLHKSTVHRLPLVLEQHQLRGKKSGYGPDPFGL